MKAAWLAGVLSLLTAAPAAAALLGVSMAMFDDPFLTTLRTGMQDYAKSKTGVTLQIVNAQNGVDRQLRQIHDFIDQKVDAIIVNAVDTDTTPKITALAAGAGMPLVYVNRLPADAKLPPKTAFVSAINFLI